MANLDRLAQEVSENNDAIDSAVTLLTDLSQRIRDLEPTAEAINALADELDANTGRLSAAILDNTPAMPEE